MLKKPGLCQILTFLFNVCLHLGNIPSIWKTVLISPIPKGKDKDKFDPLEYRGIALLSCCYKLFTKIIDMRLNRYLEFLDIYADEQNGFRRARSCEDHIFVLSSLLEYRKRIGLDTFCLFIDLRKAFDLIDHSILLLRLLQYNIDGRLFRLLHNVYKDSNGKIRLNGLLSELFSIFFGVKQGDNVSPTLFNIFVNKLVSLLNNLKNGIRMGNLEISVLLYADDMVLISGSAALLQKSMNFMNEWLKECKLILSESKTQILHFRAGRNVPVKTPLYFGNHKIDVVHQYKYLGVIFDDKLDFKAQLDCSQSKGMKALFDLRSKGRRLGGFSYMLFQELYHVCVESVTDYGLGVWGASLGKSISERCYYSALRMFLGLPKRCALSALEQESKWLPIRYRLQIEILRLYNRFCAMPPERITKRMFVFIMHDRKTSWSKMCYSVLEKLNLLEVAVNLTRVNLNECVNHLKALFVKEARLECEKKPKLRTYIQLFTEDTPSYFFEENPRVRSICANVRLGCLKLRIESGRFRNERESERLCVFCTKNAIENEIHFVMHCSLYDDIREKMLKQLNIIANNEQEKFKIIMTDKIHECGVFLMKMWQRRTSKLYVRS